MSLKAELLAGEIRAKKGLPENEEVFVSMPKIEVLEQVFTTETVDQVVLASINPMIISASDASQEAGKQSDSADTHCYSDEEGSRILQTNAWRVFQAMTATFSKRQNNSEIDIKLFGPVVVRRAGEIASAVCLLDQQSVEYKDRDISIRKLLLNMNSMSRDDIYFKVPAFKAESRKAFVTTYYELCRRLGVCASPEFKSYL